MQSTHYSCQIFINLEFSRNNFHRFLSNFINIRPVRADVFYAYGQTDGLIDSNRSTFRNFANALLKPVHVSHTYNVCAKYSMMRFI